MPFSMILIAAALTAFRTTLRGGRARRRRTVRALPLHHAAGDEADAAGGRLPGHDLLDARVRPDLRADPGRAARSEQRAAAAFLPILVPAFQVSASARRSARSPSCSSSPSRWSMCARSGVRARARDETGPEPDLHDRRLRRRGDLPVPDLLDADLRLQELGGDLRQSADVFSARAEPRGVPLGHRAGEHRALPQQQRASSPFR